MKKKKKPLNSKTKKGLSRLVDSSEVGGKTESTTVAVRWQAPEVLRKNVYSTRSDVWSFGVLIYEVVERKVPYGQDITLTQIAIEIATGNMNLPDIKNERLNQLMRFCLNVDADKRPTFKEICKMLE